MIQFRRSLLHVSLDRAGRAKTNAKARHRAIAMAKAKGMTEKYIHTNDRIGDERYKKRGDNRAERDCRILCQWRDSPENNGLHCQVPGEAQ